MSKRQKALLWFFKKACSPDSKNTTTKKSKNTSNTLQNTWLPWNNPATNLTKCWNVEVVHPSATLRSYVFPGVFLSRDIHFHPFSSHILNRKSLKITHCWDLSRFGTSPKYPDPSKLAILEIQTLRNTGSFTLPLEGSVILRVSKNWNQKKRRKEGENRVRSWSIWRVSCIIDMTFTRSCRRKSWKLSMRPTVPQLVDLVGKHVGCSRESSDTPRKC